MHGTVLGGRRPRERALALLAVGALLASCSDLPTRPRATVSVTGRVLDRDGAPLPGARLHFRNEEFDRPDQYGYVNLPTQMLGDAVSDADGRFQLSLWSGKYGISVSGPLDTGYGGFSRTAVPIVAEMAPLTFQFQGVWLRGSLIGPGGVPVEHGWVMAKPVRGEAGGVDRSYNVSQHTYEMLLPPGIYDLVAGAWPYFTNPAIPQLVLASVPVRADTTVDIVLDGTQIHGTVRGQGGAPLANIGIHVDQPYASCEAHTLVDGTYTLFTPPGVYRARLYPLPPLGYYLSRELSLVVGDVPETRDFDLSGVTWTGTVRGAGTGQPISGVTVSIRQSSLGFGSAYCTTDASGVFLVIVPQGGLFQVDALAGPGSSYPSQFVGFLTAGADSTFDIVLQPTTLPAATPERRPR